MIEFARLDPRLQEEDLGLLPSFLSENNPAPAKEQIDRNYRHGGGWRPLKAWEKHGALGIKFPGDAPLQPLAEANFRGEAILRFYPGAWLAIFGADGSFEVARID